MAPRYDNRKSLNCSCTFPNQILIDLQQSEAETKIIVQFQFILCKIIYIHLKMLNSSPKICMESNYNLYILSYNSPCICEEINLHVAPLQFSNCLWSSIYLNLKFKWKFNSSFKFRFFNLGWKDLVCTYEYLDYYSILC